MEELVVQVGTRHGRVAEVFRSGGERITLGRGYDNSLILTDPYIAPSQVAVDQRDGEWFVDVLDDTNPTRLNSHEISGAGHAIASGDQLSIGRSRLTLFSSSQPVEETRKLILNRWLHLENTGFAKLLIALMAYIALTGIYLYLDTATLFNWKAFGLAISALTLIVVLWAGFWALIGRLFRHQAHFKGQLLATLLAFGLSSLIEPLSDYFDYFSSSTLVGTISEHLVSLLYLTLLLKLNLLLATNVKRTTQAAFVGALSIVLLSYLYTSAEQPEFSTQPSYSATVKPPYAKLGRDIEMESHLDALSSMIDTIE